MPSRFTLTAIDTARANLDALPEADKDSRKVSLQDAIRALKPTLRRLERRGYSRQKLVELLREQGIQISLSSLKDYLGDSAKRPARGQSPANTSADTRASTSPAARPDARTPAPTAPSARDAGTGGPANGTARPSIPKT